MPTHRKQHKHSVFEKTKKKKKLNIRFEIHIRILRVSYKYERKIL